MSLINKLTEKSLQLQEVDYLDETLRFEVSRNESDKVVDLYSLDKNQIEWLLEIKEFKQGDKYNNYKICNDWYEVVPFIEHIKEHAKHSIHVQKWIVGYEIYEEHYIKVYTNSYYTNS